MSAMSSANAMLANGLRHAEQLVTAQMTAGISREAAVSKLFSSYKAQLDATKKSRSHADMLALTTAVGQGPWSDDQKRELAEACMGSIVAPGSARAKPHQNQICLTFENFISNAQWTYGKQAKTDQAAYAWIAGIGHLIGIRFASEKTLYHMTKIVAFCQRWRLDEISQIRVKDAKLKIQSILKNKPMPTDVPHIVQYDPAAPHQTYSKVFRK